MPKPEISEIEKWRDRISLLNQLNREQKEKKS
jgi:hypothetical protein